MTIIFGVTCMLSWSAAFAVNVATNIDGSVLLRKATPPPQKNNASHVAAPVTTIEINIATGSSGSGSASETGLDGNPLQPCSSGSQSQQSTGADRSGSCHWDAADSGYHQVCVTMTQKFLDNSASQDGNDLSSVVSVGDDWCICAWAFASAVSRGPDDAEGLDLQCSSTNSKLREVYQSNAELTGPTGNSYESAGALTFVNSKCGAS